MDVYRAVAIILVVLSHGALLSGPIFSALPSVPLPDGVELFFVLSGFLIGTILIKTLESEPLFNGKTMLHFWKRRWFRTLPNYYLILLVNYILVATAVIGGDDALDQFNWKFLFFLHNFHESFYGFFWESWSLSVEEWFYLLLPVVILGLRKFLSVKHTLLASIAVLILAPMCYRLYLLTGDPNAQWVNDPFWFDVEIRKVVIVRLDTVIYGVLGAFVAWYYPKFWKSIRWPAFIVGLVVMYFAMTTARELGTQYANVYFFTVVSIACLLFLPLMSLWKSNPIGTAGKGIAFISRISYSMYLVNLALVAQVIIKNFPPETLEQHWAAYIGFWGATITISAGLYYFWERPMMKLRDRF